MHTPIYDFDLLETEELEEAVKFIRKLDSIFGESVVLPEFREALKHELNERKDDDNE